MGMEKIPFYTSISITLLDTSPYKTEEKNVLDQNICCFYVLEYFTKF